MDGIRQYLALHDCWALFEWRLRLRTAVLPGESPQSAADRLVLSEDRRRRALHHAWLRGQELTQPADRPTSSPQAKSSETLVSLVVVGQDSSKVAA